MYDLSNHQHAGAQETVRFRPQTVAWWQMLMDSGRRIGRVHRWEAAGHGPGGAVLGLEQHSIDTLVLCLAGTVRIEDGRERLDLAAGDALVLRPGAWHGHPPLRPGALVYQQGVIAGRSDFSLQDHALRVLAGWPEQPAWRLLAAVGAADREDERRVRLRALLAHLRGESAEPLPEAHPAEWAMEYALWQNLHRGDCVARIVAAAGLARAQAYRLFRRRFGCGIATAVRHARLDLARELLSSGMPLAEVVARSGMRGRAVFARACRRRWGVPPSRLGAGLTPRCRR